MSNDESHSKDVARILNRTAARAFNMQVDEIILAFDQAEATCLNLVSSKELILEIRRRVAEWKMKLFCDRDASFEFVDKLRNDILDLDYSNLEIEGGTEIYFAQYCIRQNQADVAQLVLHELCSKLNNALKTNDLEIYRHYRKVSKELLVKTDVKK